jgi:hypothetical protein
LRIRTHQACERKGGTVLLLFAVLVLALMGIAALTVDVGYAFLAQGQMQNASDTAAVEGARLRDYNYANWYSNRSRRSRVEEMVRQNFDDDLQPQLISSTDSEYAIEYFYEPSLNLAPDTNADAYRFGMGPIIKTKNPSPDSASDAQHNIGAIIEVNSPDDQYLEDPTLKPNQGNLPYGDMLNGKFDPTVPNLLGVESQNYQREDFAPADLEAFDSTNGDRDLFESLGFLVRLRRIRQDYPAENALSPAASHGPPLPYLFGLGTAMQQAPGSDYNPRTDGISVRSTSIAACAPAFSIGYPPCNNTTIYPDGSSLGTRIIGHYGVFFKQGFWEAITVGAGHPQWNTTCYYAKIDDEGRLTLEGVSACGMAPGTPPPPASWVDALIGAEIGALGDRGNVIGDRLYRTNITEFRYGADRDRDGNVTDEDRAAARCRWIGLADGSLGGMASNGDERGFFGVYKTIVSTNPQTGASEDIPRIIGFGFGRAMLVPADPLAGTPARLIFGAGLPTPHLNVGCWVAQDNASPHLQLALLKDELEVIRPDEWAQVITAAHRFTYEIYEPGDPQAEALRYDYRNIRLGAVLAATLVR